MAAHMYFPQPRGEHGVHSWVLQQVLGEFGTASWTFRVTVVDVLLEALETEIMLARS